MFSINCYAVDPTSAIERVCELGVDLPVMIGEFHFGALDAGPDRHGPGGRRVNQQRARRGLSATTLSAWPRIPCGVGCHYFQCYDQFVTGAL